MQTLKALSNQVASLSTKVDSIEARSTLEGAAEYFEANAITQQPRNSYKQRAQTRYQQQGPSSYTRQSAPNYFQNRPPFSTQTGFQFGEMSVIQLQLPTSCLILYYLTALDVQFSV